MRLLLLLLALLLMGSGEARPHLYVQRDWTDLRISPPNDPMAELTNHLWENFDLQYYPTPPITEGLFTLYGYSETAWGVVNLRSLDYEQALAYGHALRTPIGEFYVYLRECGVDRFRACLRDRGFDGVLALKSDDVGRVALVSFYDQQTETWTDPLRLVVLDSLGGGWDRLRDTYHPLNSDVPMRWIGDVSKDAVEAAGLGHLVRLNRSGFMRLEFSEVWDYEIVWPEYK